MTLIPPECKNDVLRLLKEQHSKNILYINMPDSPDDDLLQFLSTHLDQNVHIESVTLESISEDHLRHKWHVILINDINLYKNGNLVEIIQSLKSFATQSIIVVSPMYISSDNKPANLYSGNRYVYPTRFHELDYTYQRYNGNEQWQIYNFYTNNKYNYLLPIDKISYSEKIPTDRKLNVVYALPHMHLTGGLKYLLTHAKFLCSRGHHVYLLCFGAQSAIPKWSGLRETDITGQICIGQDDDLSETLRKYNIDIVVAGFFPQLHMLSECGIPVLYWEQGSENLYGEWGTVQASNSPQLDRIRKIYHLPIAIASVSPFVSSVLKAKYGRITPLLYTGIDTDFYRPINDRCEKPHSQTNILLVGNPTLAFKGFHLILSVLNKLWNNGYQFQVTWASQIPLKVKSSLPIRVLSNLSQEALSELYRTSDILISGSVYESFPMPPMEAFASGTAVVSTDNGGIHVYAKPGENILLAEQGNFADLYAAVEFMLKNPEARRKIALNARKDALQFSIDHAIDQLENILYHIVLANDGKSKKHSKHDTPQKNIEPDDKNDTGENSAPIDNPICDPITNLPRFNSLNEMIKTGEGLEAVVSFNEQKTLLSRLDILTNLCAGKSIVHIGCTDHIPLIKFKMEHGTWLHGILTKTCKEILGIDINKDAINYVQSIGIDNVIYGDITKPGNTVITNKHWDYILFAEMLEHLTDPIGFLKQVIKNYGQYTDHFVITVPNAFGLPFLTSALKKGEERINPDHKFWFTPYTLWKILDSAGLDVISLLTCAYENSYPFLKSNEALVLQHPLLQDTIVAIASVKKT